MVVFAFWAEEAGAAFPFRENGSCGAGCWCCCWCLGSILSKKKKVECLLGKRAERADGRSGNRYPRISSLKKRKKKVEKWN